MWGASVLVSFRKVPIAVLINSETREDSGPSYPLVSPSRKRRLNGTVLRMRPEKPRPRVTAGEDPG
jgi:hypothetical protein